MKITSQAPSAQRAPIAFAPQTRFDDDALLIARDTTPSRASAALSAALAKPTKQLQRAARVVAPALPYLLVAGSVACLVGVASGYPCTGYDAAATQNFSNANNTIFGYIHGWFSDCYDYSYACGQSCSGSGTSSSCSTVYCTATASDEAPSHYVSSVASAVQKCGFDLVNSIPAGAATRIANGLIEKNRWVKIVVNQLNQTSVTDPGVLCLHGIN